MARGWASAERPPEGLWRLPSGDVAALLDNPWFRVLPRLQDVFVTASIDFFRSRGLCAATLPITTHAVSSPMAPGSDSSPVRVELEGVPTYLADSMQFPLELACRVEARGAYYLLPSFRGEQPDERHLSQFYHAEAEIRGSLDDVILLVEDYVRHLASAYLGARDASEFLASWIPDPQHLRAAATTERFPEVPFEDAVALLGVAEGALSAEDERKLLAQHGGGPLWLTRPRVEDVPFYQANCADSPARALAADLLMGIGETVGCGERHADSTAVLDALRSQGVDPGDYAWYIDMKRERPLRTAGFGLGMERFLLWVLDHDDIRDLQMLPRANGRRLTP